MITKYGKVVIESADGSDYATCRIEGFEGQTSTPHQLNIEAIGWALDALDFAAQSRVSITVAGPPNHTDGNKK